MGVTIAQLVVHHDGFIRSFWIDLQRLKDSLDAYKLKRTINRTHVPNVLQGKVNCKIINGVIRKEKHFIFMFVKKNTINLIRCSRNMSEDTFYPIDLNVSF